MSRVGVLSSCLLGVLASVYVLIAPAAQAQAGPQILLTRHVRDSIVTGEAQPVGRPPATQTMLFDIVLPLRHQPELDSFLRELYDPTSSSYRHFLTPQEFTARFGPSQEVYDAVLDFAAASGFKIVGGSRDGMDVQLRGSVASVENAFHVTMKMYQHPAENRTFFAPDREPTTDLPFQLWHISGLDNFSLPRPLFKHSSVKALSVVAGSCPGGYFCGSDMRAAYYGGTLTGTGQNIALLELAGTDLADLDTYYSTAKQTKPYTPTLVSTGGYGTTCLDSSGCEDAEQTLDMTQAMGMAPGSTMLYMYVCGDAFGSGAFSETACYSAMSTASPLSYQISSSWAWVPADPLTDDPYFEKFAAQGQNFFVASGDSGSYQNNPSGFYYPAEDYYVTAVGGTDLKVSKAGGPWSSETAWSDSGGGFSPDGFAIPSWQQIAGVINASNDGSIQWRNVPDVAAEANFDFYVCSNQSGCDGGWGGTSFAAPMWAGYMALINQQAIANGNPPVGLLTPSLYSIGVGSNYNTDFHDITSGSNGPSLYSAVSGYDLVTGWGSPKGSGLINALSGTSGPSFTLAAVPTTADIVPPGSTTNTIAVYPVGGFAGGVTLSASGLPAGVTAAFVPNPATTTSTLTLTASASVPGGLPPATVQITGISGSLQAMTQVSLSLNGPVAPLATPTPNSLTFPNTVLGSTSPTRNVTLANNGSATLNISKIAASANFALRTSVKPCGKTLAAGKTCIISVSFTPKTPGKLNGNITITDNASNSPQTVALTGTGVAPATLTPSSATYAAWAVGATSLVRTFTLANNQTVELTGIVISTTGDFASSTTTCATSLPALQKCTIGVVFKPTAKGTRTGKLSVSDSAGNSPQASSLTGTGK